MTVNAYKFGPGTLTLGPVGTPIDASCQLRNGQVAWDKDEEDPITVLCGDVIAGATTYSATLAGNMIQDLSTGGIVEWSWDNKGTEQDFIFIPNDAAAVQVSGVVVVDPLSVGSTEDFGATMASDFEWTIVGEPVLGAVGGGARSASSTSERSSSSSSE